METGASTSVVCSADVAAFVDALETINIAETECYDTGENVVICVSDPEMNIAKDSELSVTDIEDACTETGSNYFNPDTRKLKAIMQQLVSQKKAIIIKKSLTNTKGTKQFKSDVWNWFGDVRLFISESDAERLKIPYYMRLCGDEQAMICKVFVGCFRCSALFMYDAQKHSTSTLRYHVRACNRPKECIFVSEDRMDDESTEALESERQQQQNHPSGSAPKVKRFRTDPRKQKEVIEQLFQKQKAVVTRKSFMNMKGNRRFKSDVWNWFGDIKLLISRSEAKQLKIPYYIRRCGDEQLVLSKVFVGCFKCMALFIHDSQKSTSTLRYHIRTCSRPKERKKRTTPNIIFFPNKKSPKQPEALNDADAIPAHEKLLNFALSSESSLDVIKDPEFHKILQMCITVGAIYGDVNIDSLLCATPTLTSFILNDLYVSTVNAFYTEFQHSYGATYKLNIWIDEQVKAPFISVYCSYANASGELKSVIIHTDDFDYESKTVENVREWFAHFLADQPVIPFKRLIAIDNESNLVTAFKDEPCIKCSVQHLTNILQLASTKAANNTNSELPDFTNLLGSCVELVVYFDQISNQYQLPEELNKCTDDKWTSILGLFRSINNQYDNILKAVNATNATHMLSVEKSTLTAIVAFFKVFEDAILQLSSSTEPTLNLVIPWVAKLQKHCAVESHDPTALKQFKTNIGLEINDRLVKSITVYHRMATFLDPRFKKMVFGSPSEHREASVKVKCLVKECMESPNMEELVDSRKAHVETNDRFSDLYSANSFDTSKCEKAALEEVDKYLAEPFQIVNQDLSQQNKFPVLKYWKQHSDIYPNLCRIAMWLLSCPASCVQENEMTFWSNNWLINCPRFPIPPDNVNKVLFVKTFQGL
ncbi:transposable element Hobo transposase [Trichonephila inaurata madagascariensis]|uniref:Transposable element Hobo transposase n=1 Tax=Trichonephila inaurata madagascariensis TaxID=2747483 RepID=A0A8X6YS62_9ARAC|nr:transposable element Hobo transposase [Trichonephila inaurata madagascariensis]